MRPRLLVSASLPLPPPTPTLSPDASYSCYGDPVESSGIDFTNLIVGIDFTKSNEWTVIELVEKCPKLDSLLRQEICPICLTNPKDMAFGCGHQIF
ncbi:hypothetical protein ACS0TY_036115 [Phlomoides rotata]